jgi:hypothetical protein
MSSATLRSLTTDPSGGPLCLIPRLPMPSKTPTGLRSIIELIEEHCLNLLRRAADPLCTFVANSLVTCDRENPDACLSNSPNARVVTT